MRRKKPTRVFAESRRLPLSDSLDLQFRGRETAAPFGNARKSLAIVCRMTLHYFCPVRLLFVIFPAARRYRRDALARARNLEEEKRRFALRNRASCCLHARSAFLTFSLFRASASSFDHRSSTGSSGARSITLGRFYQFSATTRRYLLENEKTSGRDTLMDRSRRASIAMTNRVKMNAPVYAASCPALQSNLSLHSSSYYSEYSGAASRRRRLSSTGEADTSATSSYEGSDSSENSDESRLEPVSQVEREQLEAFFRSLKSQVFVCESLANLYLGSASQTERWDLRFTGIPVVVLDLGETRSRSKRRIQILLAERGTCFTLWRETIDNLSSYKVSGPAFHTMCLSSDHTRLAGLSFDNPKAANDLWQHIERLISCPENISLSVPGKKKKKPVQKKVVLPAKSNISQPCQFQHVTSVDAADRSRYFSLQTLVPALNELGNSLEANF